MWRIQSEVKQVRFSESFAQTFGKIRQQLLLWLAVKINCVEIFVAAAAVVVVHSKPLSQQIWMMSRGSCYRNNHYLPLCVYFSAPNDQFPPFWTRREKHRSSCCSSSPNFTAGTVLTPRIDTLSEHCSIIRLSLVFATFNCKLETVSIDAALPIYPHNSLSILLMSVQPHENASLKFLFYPVSHLQ